MTSNSKPVPAPRTYISGGQVLSSPPLTARLQNYARDAYNFAGLYVTTLFSFDPYNAASESPFATQNRAAPMYRPVRGSGPSRGGGGGGGGSGPGGPGGRRVGRVDDIRAPECGSCR